MKDRVKDLIDKLNREHSLAREEFVYLIENQSEEAQTYAADLAAKTTLEIYGDKVYVRGLIEFTNYCKNNCFYCGIRAGNTGVSRYRLTADEICECADEGYELGFRTFVLQGGEDPYYTDDIICHIISEIKRRHQDCAITLSIGEKSKDSYKAYRDAGADRYLLRHETATVEHYNRLHPDNISAEHRYQCLRDLKELGYQTGAGFMVGSPFQTSENLADDLLFIKDLEPAMVGIGPFIPAAGTPFANEKPGTLEQTLYLLSLIRLLLPEVLLPATTALGTIHPLGRELGLEAGANVLMPNLSPKAVRDKYKLYDNKICTGEEAAECVNCLENRVKSVGRRIVVDRGDNIAFCD
ncbi:MAG: [FeFe] hydrogenase H-cluster radical SAM maturase HydE [Lachnospiraceae bacterium]|nr:[FeFe] hydrogenase H-cluster radical SAM maturase HydE [Lachnospiraceae bacterium]